MEEKLMADSKFKDVSKFIGEKATSTNDTTFSMTQKDYLKLANQHGVTEEMVKAVAEFNNLYRDGSVDFLASQLGDAIKAAKKAGDDPKESEVKLSTRTPGGVEKTSMRAYKEHHNPKTGESISSYGEVRLTVQAKSRLNKDNLKEAQDRIQKFLSV
jgi:vacuolar-type H+-ATPase subunit I/STV1